MSSETKKIAYLKTKGLKTDLFSYSQDEIYKSLPEFDKTSSRQLSKLFKSSSISNRYSIFENLLNEGEFSFQKISLLSTADRNNLYRKHAPQIFHNAAKAILNEIDNFDYRNITHIITASCT